jgi:hypothetical protein
LKHSPFVLSTPVLSEVEGSKDERVKTKFPFSKGGKSFNSLLRKRRVREDLKMRS